MSSLQQAPARAPTQAPAAPIAAAPEALGTGLAAERAALPPSSGLANATPTLDLAVTDPECAMQAALELVQWEINITATLLELHEARRTALLDLANTIELGEQPPVFPDLLVTVAAIALGAAASGVGGFVGGTLVASSAGVLRTALKKAFEKAIELTTKESVLATSAAAFEKPGTVSSEAFYLLQRDALDEIDWRAIEAFQDSIDLSAVRPSDVAAAAELDATLKGLIDGATQIQRSAALQAWCVYQAQAELGATQGGGTDLGGALHGSDPTWMAFMSSEPMLNGVLQLEVEGTSPKEPLRIRRARLAGLDPDLRRELSKVPLGDLEIPVVIHGTVDPPDDRFTGRGHFFLGRDEQDGVWCELDHSGGLEYLRARAGHDTPAPDSAFTDPDVLDGRFDWARTVLERDILEKPLADLGVTLDA